VKSYPTRRELTHHALDDARAQAELAQLLLGSGQVAPS
jgi:DNA polymerase III epsilon subunit-like protein